MSCKYRMRKGTNGLLASPSLYYNPYVYLPNMLGNTITELDAADGDLSETGSILSSTLKGAGTGALAQGALTGGLSGILGGTAIGSAAGVGAGAAAGTGLAAAGGLASGAAGAAGGAAAGSVVPIIGTAIGALVGAGAGALIAKKKKKEKARKEKEIKSKIRQVEDPLMSSYNPYTPLMPLGGIVPYGNETVELERGEPYMLPDGTIDKISDSAPTHTNGGVKIELPSGTKVLGKKVSGSKSFKELGSKLKGMQDKYEKALGEQPNSIARKTAELMLGKVQDQFNNLFVEQGEDVDSLLTKVGTKNKYPSVRKGQNGLLAGYTPDQVKNFQKYAGIGIDGIVGPQTIDAYNILGSEYERTLQGLPAVSPISSSLALKQSLQSPVETESMLKSDILSNNTLASRKFKISTGTLADIGQGIGTVAPILYNLGQGLSPAEQLDYRDYINPYAGEARAAMRDRRFNIDPILEANKAAEARYRYNLKQSAPSQSQYLAGLSASQISRQRADATAVAQKQNIENQYLAEQAQLDATLGQQIVDRALKIKKLNMGSKAAKRKALSTAASQIQQAVQTAKASRNRQRAYEQQLALLSDIIPSYSYTPGYGFNYLTQPR